MIRASAGWLLHPQRAGAAMAMRPGELPKDAEGRVKSPYTLEMRARQSAQLFQALGSATSEALAKVAPEEKAALLGSIAELVRRDAKTDRFKREAALEPLAQIAVSALPGWCKDGEVAQRAAGAADTRFAAALALAEAVQVLLNAEGGGPRPQLSLLGPLCATLQNITVTCRMANGSAHGWLGGLLMKAMLDADTCELPQCARHVMHVVANALADVPAMRKVLSRGSPPGDALAKAALRAAVATKKSERDGAGGNKTPQDVELVAAARASVIRLQRGAAAACGAADDAAAIKLLAKASSLAKTAAGAQAPPLDGGAPRLTPQQVQQAALQVLQAHFTDIKAALDQAMEDGAKRQLRDLVVVIDLQMKRNSVHLLDEWRKQRGFPLGWFMDATTGQVHTAALSQFMQHVEANVAQAKDDDIILCVRTPTGGNLMMMRASFKLTKPKLTKPKLTKPPPSAAAVMASPPDIQGDMDAEDFDFDVERDYDGDEDKAYESLVGSLAAPTDAPSDGLLAKLTEAFWEFLAWLAHMLHMDGSRPNKRAVADCCSSGCHEHAD